MCGFLCGHKFSAPLGKYQGEWLLNYPVRACLVCKKLPNHFPKCLHYFAFLPAVNESSCSFMSSPAFSVLRTLDFGHSIKYVVISHYGFNLHFPHDIWHGASVTFPWFIHVAARIIPLHGWIKFSIIFSRRNEGSTTWVFQSASTTAWGKIKVTLSNFRDGDIHPGRP